MERIKQQDLTPSEIVEKLDQYIIGQTNAKRAVAVALRNRYRRLKLPEEIRDEVAPKNILMIGPTGVGKTEIARRLAKLCGAPFIKVEATKYTEVGYVGRDVESMVRDLMAVAINDVKAEMEEELKEKSAEVVEEKLLDLLLPGTNEKEKAAAKEGKKTAGFTLGNIFGGTAPSSNAGGNVIQLGDSGNSSEPELSKEDQEKKDEEDRSTREKFRQWLREGKLEDREVEVTVKPIGGTNMEIIAGGNIEDLENSMQGIVNMINGGGKSKKRMVSVREARKIITEETLENMVDRDKAVDIAKERVTQSGIIFIDEIDKIAVHNEAHGGSVSREGVQRDILPIVEGSNVNTKWGVIDTTHILFIAAGAFSMSKPSDLIPELQGRFPLRVELESLHKDEFRRILTEPKNSLTMQYTKLMETEGVTLNITEDAIERMSYIAEDVNAKAENIGARRLHTIMEKVLDEISFDADKHSGETIVVDASYVDSKLNEVASSEDLSRYIL
ncbi:MAG: ATP-dependent protease ATPase subunit HslU [Treponema sp.]|nr:ATP-dependent protease ATPase subunit HslU [Treponema sp.]